MKYENISKEESDFVVYAFLDVILKNASYDDVFNPIYIKEHMEQFFDEFGYLIIHSDDEKYRYKIQKGLVEKYDANDIEVQ